MKDNKHLLNAETIHSSDDNITDSFPLMLILMTFFVISFFQLLIFPYAKEFARFFVNY